MSEIPSLPRINKTLGVSGLSKALGVVDPDAQAYIDAVNATAATVSTTQETAIDDFVKAEKSAGRWDEVHSRIWLPIWENASANAICMKSLATGSFNGTVTHGSGYVASDGSTGYFNTNVQRSDNLFNETSGSIWRLCSQRTSGTVGSAAWELCGRIGGSSTRFTLGVRLNSPPNMLGIGPVASVAMNPTEPPEYQGISIFSQHASNARFLGHQNTGNGWQILSFDTTDVPSPTQLTDGQLLFLANNISTTSSISVSDYNKDQQGAFGFGFGMSQAEAEAFSGNLKNLWETCTGQTLP